MLVHEDVHQVSATTGQTSKRYGLVYVDLDDDGNGSLAPIKKGFF